MICFIASITPGSPMTMTDMEIKEKENYNANTKTNEGNCKRL